MRSVIPVHGDGGVCAFFVVVVVVLVFVKREVPVRARREPHDGGGVHGLVGDVRDGVVFRRG